VKKQNKPCACGHQGKNKAMPCAASLTGSTPVAGGVKPPKGTSHLTH